MGSMIRHGWQMLASSPAAAACVLLGAAMQVAYRLSVPYFFQQTFDGGIVGGDTGVLYRCLFGLAAALALFAIGILLQERAMSRLGSLATNRLRLKLFEKLLAMPPGMHAQHGPASVVNRMGGDLEQVETALVRGAPLFLVQGTIVLASIVLLFAIEWRLALLVLASLPLAVMLSKPFRHRGHRARRESDVLRTRLLKLTNEASTGHALLRILGGNADALSRFGVLVQRFGLFQVRSHFMSALSARSAQVSAGVTQLVVIGVGGWLAHQGYMSGGLLVAFITLLGNVSGGISYIAEAGTLLTRGVAALSEIDDILRQPGDIADRPGAQAIPSPTRAIAFEKVSFSYGGRPALQDVTFVVPPGQRVCLVGPSGSGKSTVLALLARLLEPDRGLVSLDGCPLSAVTDASLRRVITMVPQNPLLFEGTVRENILIGRPDAPEEALACAGAGAALDGVIASLPDGWDSPVGEGGGMLSGGQRQRVAIARALVRDAPILLLDEATSALDVASEAVVNETFMALGPDRTVLAVTHRLAVAAAFDRVLVFDRGRLVQDGPHARLIEEPGVYAQLWQRVSRLPADGEPSSTCVSEDWLRTLPFLASCPASLLRALSPQFLSEQVPEDREVFRQGDQGDRFYILVRGTVEVIVEGTDRSPTRVALLRDGDFFGEVALLSGRTRNATIRTLTDCLFLTLHRASFLMLLSQDEEAGTIVRAAMAARTPEPVRLA